MVTMTTAVTAMTTAMTTGVARMRAAVSGMTALVVALVVRVVMSLVVSTVMSVVVGYVLAAAVVGVGRSVDAVGVHRLVVVLAGRIRLGSVLVVMLPVLARPAGTRAGITMPTSARLVVVSTHRLVLMGEIGQLPLSVIERWRRGVRAVQVDPDPGSGNLAPEVLDDRSQGWSGGTGDHQQVGVSHGRRCGPPSPGQFGFQRQTRGGGPHGRHHQDVRSAGAGTQEQSGQVHRSAPSRQA